MGDALDTKLAEQLTAIRNTHGQFLRFHFAEGDQIRPDGMFKAARAAGFVNWRLWLWRDGDAWWDATLTPTGLAALAAHEALQSQPTPPISPEQAQFNAIRHHERFGPLDEKGNPIDPRRRG